MKKHKNVSREKYSLIEVRLGRLRRIPYKDKYDIREESTYSTCKEFQSQPDSATQYRMQLSNIFTVNFIFRPSKANNWRPKNISCNRNEPKKCMR